MSGYLHIITGPMFSGKTTRLIELYNHYKQSNYVLVFNHTLDKRYVSKDEQKIVSHDKITIDCNFISRPIDILSHKDFNSSKVIIIDEAQFFDSFKEIVLFLVEFYKKTIIVSGLMTDFNRDVFGELLSLIPFADEVEIKKGKCKFCNNKGLFTEKNRSRNEVIEVGSSDVYAIVCRCHYLNKSLYI
jgi:thymidine kinase